jgi:hypothetical protein
MAPAYSKIPLKVDLQSFDGTDAKYALWRFQVDQILESRGLTRLTEDIRYRPQKDLDDEKLTVDELEDLPNLKLVITSSLRGEAQVYASSCVGYNLPGLLQTFDERWNSQNAANRMVYLKKLINEGVKPGQCLAKYFASKQTLLKENLRNTITVDELLMLACITNLPNKYKDMGSMLLSDPQLTWHKAERALLDREAGVKNDKESDEHEVQLAALQAKVDELQAEAHWTSGESWMGKGKGKRSQGKGKGKNVIKWDDKKVALYNAGKCFKCGSTKHKSAQCPQNKKKA